MSSAKQIQHAKEIFQATLEAYKKAATQQKSDKDPVIQAICNEWQGIIDSGTIIKKLSEIENFESLLGYQRQFKNKNLTPEQVISIDKQRAAEIDLATHLQRNYRQEKITKLPEVSGHKTPDFAVGDDNPSLYEAKFLETYSESAVEKKIQEGLEQVKGYVDDNSIALPFGKVHIFTFDRIDGVDKMGIQRHIEQLVCKYHGTYSFPFEVSLQVYGHDYYDYNTHNCR